MQMHSVFIEHIERLRRLVVAMGPILRKKLLLERNRLSGAEELVADPPRYSCPVEVHENKVTIYPVQVD